MDLNTYQQSAHKTASPDADPIMALLGLCGEVGELADIYKKQLYHGHEIDEPKLRLELGDILWYLAEACTQFGYTLEQVAELNLAKLQERYGRAFTSQASINRKD